MSMDYKEDIQRIFEELCRKRYAADYWELSQDTQFKLYSEAQSLYIDRMADQADYLRKAEREKGA